MITPVSMNNSAMNVKRVRPQRRSNGYDSVSFGHKFNTANFQKGAKGIFDKAVKFAQTKFNAFKDLHLLKKAGKLIKKGASFVSGKAVDLFNGIKAKFPKKA